jgi:hypothetical protein
MENYTKKLNIGGVIMLKILISSVGMHDPFGYSKDGVLSEGPVMGAVKELKPDIVFLFPTRKQLNDKLTSTEENSQTTTEEIKKVLPKVKVYQRPLNLPDPTDYCNIIKYLREELEDIKNNYARSQVDYCIAISSGTSQIQAAFLVLVNSNRIKADVFQIIDPKFLEPGEKRVRKVETHFLEEENQIVRAKKYFSRVNYFESKEELLELGLFTTYPERAEKAEIFVNLIEGYFYWDLYQHPKALEKLTYVLPFLKRYNLNELDDIISDQASVLREIVSLADTEDYLNLIDLYHNALRRERCKQFVDCLSRFKRLVEGTYFYFAKRDLNLSLNSKKYSKQPDWVKKIVKKKEDSYLSMHDVSLIYERKLGKKIIPHQLEDEINAFSTQRNYTINNHGMKSVEEQDSRKAMTLITKLLKITFPDKEINDYCLSKQKLELLEENIFKNI